MIAVEPGALEGVLIFSPKLHRDARGSFQETFILRTYREAGIQEDFVQDNRSYSATGVLRGLHYQVTQPQGHLVYVTQGKIADVGLDLRRLSPTFGRWMRVWLSSEEGRQVYWPPGIAHGYCVVSEGAALQYKCTDYYRQGDEAGVLWNDPDLGIEWPMENPSIDARDAAFPRLKDVPPDRLPRITAHGGGR